MPLKLQAIGKPLDPVVRPYSADDVILYALAVGCGFDHLDYCYEKDLKVLPTFVAAHSMDFFWQVVDQVGAERTGIVHAGHCIDFHAPIPTAGQTRTTGRIVRIDDKGSATGALIEAHFEIDDGKAKRLASGAVTIFARNDGGFRGTARPAEAFAYPQRPPDTIVPAQPRGEQPLLYRLTGDHFALHADPEFARRAGFDGPVMHGLCTLGFATVALIDTFITGQPQRLSRLACRFTRPLYPGVPIETYIWQVASNRALWRTVEAGSGALAIDRGQAQWH